MEAKGWMLFNILMQKYRPQDAQLLLSLLPPEDAQNSAKHPIVSQDPLSLIASPEAKLSWTHYSWLAPIIQQQPESLRPLILASLPREQLQGVARLTKTPLPKVRPSSPVKRYLIKDLANHLVPSEVLPVDYLPEAALTPLAHMSKEELVRLIDYIGLRDLAEAVRPIVDKRLLQVIHQCLTPEELHLLRVYMHQREKLKVSKLEFSQWDGKRDSLRLLYHQRGLARLAKALSGCPENLVWHITHRLDQQRASLIKRLMLNEEVPGVSKTLIQQILALIDFLKRPKNEP